MENVPTVLLIGADDGVAERLDEETSQSYHIKRISEPAGVADTPEAEVALVVLDGRSAGSAAGHLLATVRERGYDGPVLSVVDDPEDRVDAVEHYLVEPVGAADLRAAVEGLVPAGSADGDSTVFEALADAKGRRCCRVLLEAPHSAQELAAATGYSLPTVYRRLDALQAAGLVESRTRIRSGGGHYEVYRTVTSGVWIDIADGFRVDRERGVDGPQA